MFVNKRSLISEETKILILISQCSIAPLYSWSFADCTKEQSNMNTQKQTARKKHTVCAARVSSEYDRLVVMIVQLYAFKYDKFSEQ